jgi:MFS family permease
MQRYLRLLRENSEFSKLWLSMVISLLGDWFSTVVLASMVLRYSNGSGLAVSIFLALRSIAPSIFTPFGGWLLDRFNRQHILVMSNILRALIVPLFLFATGEETLWVIYLITAIQFSLATVSEPGQTALLPSLLHPQDIIEGNTLFSVTWSVMLAAGAVIGGFFAYFFGANAAILADAFSFLVASLLILMVKYDPEEARKRKEALNIETIHERDTSFQEGLRYIKATPPIMAAIFVKFGQSLANVDTLMTIFGAQLFVIGAKGELSLGALFFALGLGTLIGPMISNRFNDGTVKQMRRLISIGFILSVIGWPLIGWGGSLMIVAIAIFIRGMGVSINWTYSNVIIQKIAPDSKLGRMFSIDMLGYYLAALTSTLVHGWLIDVLGVEHIAWIAWGTLVVALIPTAIWLWLVPKLEKMEAENPHLVAMAGD